MSTEFRTDSNPESSQLSAESNSKHTYLNKKFVFVSLLSLSGIVGTIFLLKHIHHNHQNQAKLLAQQKSSTNHQATANNDDNSENVTVLSISELYHNSNNVFSKCFTMNISKITRHGSFHNFKTFLRDETISQLAEISENARVWPGDVGQAPSIVVDATDGSHFYSNVTIRTDHSLIDFS